MCQNDHRYVQFVIITILFEKCEVKFAVGNENMTEFVIYNMRE